MFADNRSIGDGADYNQDQQFFAASGRSTTTSLLMTQEVLKEWKQLETVVEGLQPQVKAGLATY